MARRILSADTALMPQAQPSLQSAGHGEFRGGFFQWLQDRWSTMLNLRPEELLFDWNDPTALMNEIAFVNQTRERLDEAAVKIAPSMLRIVLTVKAHLDDPQAQRAFLAEHVDWDFRRISELCIVADSYGLLDLARREHGSREIQRYGWSNALKLAYVRDPADRHDLWERARGTRERASYRAVLEEMRRFRERKQIGPPAGEAEVAGHLDAVRDSLGALQTASRELSTPEQYQALLGEVKTAHRELGRLKRAIQERIDSVETEALAEHA